MAGLDAKFVPALVNLADLDRMRGLDWRPLVQCRWHWHHTIGPKTNEPALAGRFG
jgi:hypothetical protein